MLNLTPKTLSPSPFLFNSIPIPIPIPIPQNPNPKFLSQSRPSFKSEYQTERGHEFETGDTFFRHESATGRDLSVLAASLYKKSKSKLRVLNALCGCGIRSLRYLVETERRVSENHIGEPVSRREGFPGEWKKMGSDAFRRE